MEISEIAHDNKGNLGHSLLQNYDLACILGHAYLTYFKTFHINLVAFTCYEAADTVNGIFQNRKKKKP